MIFANFNTCGCDSLLNQLRKFARGESYWKVILTSGREISEVQTITYQGKNKRPIQWLEDVVNAGDAARIAELWICTPRGDAALRITEPYSAYQCQQGVLTVQGRRTTAQIIGRVDDKATGRGVAFIWDVITQQLYRDSDANVTAFAAWRPGVVPPGALALPVIGVRL